MAMQKVSLHNINGGAVIRMANDGLDRILENIQDEETPAKAVRGLKIEIIMKPDKDREKIIYAVKVSPKLQGKVSGGFMEVIQSRGELIIAEEKREQLEFDFNTFDDRSSTLKAV